MMPWQVGTRISTVMPAVVSQKNSCAALEEAQRTGGA
jgi:hypothetical protein